MVFSFLSPSSQFFTIRTDRKQVLFIFSKLSNEKKTHGKIRTALRTNKIVSRLEKNKYIYISRGSFSLDIYPTWFCLQQSPLQEFCKSCTRHEMQRSFRLHCTNSENSAFKVFKTWYHKNS